MRKILIMAALTREEYPNAPLFDVLAAVPFVLFFAPALF